MNAEIDEQQIQIFVTEEAPVLQHPCYHGHHWAWAQLVRGGVRKVCRVCGTEAANG